MSGALLAALAAVLVGVTAFAVASTLRLPGPASFALGMYVLAFAEVVLLILLLSAVDAVTRTAIVVGLIVPASASLVGWFALGARRPPSLPVARLRELRRVPVLVALTVATAAALVYVLALVVGTPPSSRSELALVALATALAIGTKVPAIYGLPVLAALAPRGEPCRVPPAANRRRRARRRRTVVLVRRQPRSDRRAAGRPHRGRVGRARRIPPADRERVRRVRAAPRRRRPPRRDRLRPLPLRARRARRDGSAASSCPRRGPMASARRRSPEA